MPEGAVYVGRPTFWGNPFVAGTNEDEGVRRTPAKAVASFRQYMR